MISGTYVNGVIAAKEKYFLGEKMLRLCETDAESVLRALKENGFGAADAESGDELRGGIEEIIAKEEDRLFAFVREYASCEAELQYFLAPSDVHNVKAAFKAKLLNEDAEKYFGRVGTIATNTIKSAFESGNYDALPEYLQRAIEAAEALCTDGVNGKGASVGAVFEKAKYEHLKKACKKSVVLLKLLEKKADLVNLTSAMRSADEGTFKETFVTGGALAADDFAFCFSESDVEAKKAYERACFRGKKKAAAERVYGVYLRAREIGGVAEAEKAVAETEIAFFVEKRYELREKEAFLYSGVRKASECANARIVAVCLNAGMKESEIKRRLRGVEGARR